MQNTISVLSLLVLLALGSTSAFAIPSRYKEALPAPSVVRDEAFESGVAGTELAEFLPVYVQLWNPDFVQGAAYLHAEIATAIERARDLELGFVSILFDRKNLLVGTNYPVKPVLPGSIQAREFLKFMKEEFPFEKIEIVIVEDTDLITSFRKEMAVFRGQSQIELHQISRGATCESYLKQSRIRR